MSNKKHQWTEALHRTRTDWHVCFFSNLVSACLVSLVYVQDQNSTEPSPKNETGIKFLPKDHYHR